METGRTSHAVHRKGVPVRGSRNARLVAPVSMAYRYLACFGERRPDIVHVHTSQSWGFVTSAAYVLTFSNYWDVPVVLHVHGSRFDRFVEDASGGMARLQRAVFGTVDITIAVSDDTAEVIRTTFPTQRVVVLRHCVNVEEYRPAGADGADGNGAVEFLFVSNLIPRKGIRELSAAVERMGDQFAAGDGRASLTIAGKGPLAEVAESLAERYDSVEYRGFVTEKEKIALLNEADVFVLPTASEAGVPIAIVEGLAGGNAIITTGVSGIPELIGRENGVLVPPNDPEALADAMETILVEPRLGEMCADNHALVQREFTTDAMAEKLDVIYATVERSSGGRERP